MNWQGASILCVLLIAVVVRTIESTTPIGSEENLDLRLANGEIDAGTYHALAANPSAATYALGL